MLLMKYRTRIQYTEADKALMWERWRRGESLNAIARLFDRNHSAIGGILSRTGISSRYRQGRAIRRRVRSKCVECAVAPDLSSVHFWPDTGLLMPNQVHGAWIEALSDVDQLPDLDHS